MVTITKPILKISPRESIAFCILVSFLNEYTDNINRESEKGKTKIRYGNMISSCTPSLPQFPQFKKIFTKERERMPKFLHDKYFFIVICSTCQFYPIPTDFAKNYVHFLDPATSRKTY